MSTPQKGKVRDASAMVISSIYLGIRDALALNNCPISDTAVVTLTKLAVDVMIHNKNVIHESCSGLCHKEPSETYSTI